PDPGASRTREGFDDDALPVARLRIGAKLGRALALERGRDAPGDPRGRIEELLGGARELALAMADERRHTGRNQIAERNRYEPGAAAERERRHKPDADARLDESFDRPRLGRAKDDLRLDVRCLEQRDRVVRAAAVLQANEREAGELGQ